MPYEDSIYVYHFHGMSYIDSIRIQYAKINYYLDLRIDFVIAG